MTLFATATSDLSGTLFAPEFLQERRRTPRTRRPMVRTVVHRAIAIPPPRPAPSQPYAFEEDAERWDGLA